MSNALDAFLGQKFCLAMTGRATRLSVYNGFAFRHLCLLTLELLMVPSDNVPSQNRRHYWGLSGFREFLSVFAFSSLSARSASTIPGDYDLLHLVHDAVSAKGAHSEDDLLLVIHYEQYRLLLFHARRPVVLFLPARSYLAALRIYSKRSPPAYAGGASRLYDPPRALAVQVRRVSVVVSLQADWGPPASPSRPSTRPGLRRARPRPDLPATVRRRLPPDSHLRRR